MKQTQQLSCISHEKTNNSTKTDNKDKRKIWPPPPVLPPKPNMNEPSRNLPIPPSFAAKQWSWYSWYKWDNVMYVEV